MFKSPDLMRDRHLDQIIMCCIYVLSKVYNRSTASVADTAVSRPPSLPPSPSAGGENRGSDVSGDHETVQAPASGQELCEW